MEERIFDGILEHLDVTYMLCVNVICYILFHTFPVINKEKEKLCATITVGLVLAAFLHHFGQLELKCATYSFILSLVAWDYVLKPLTKKFNIHYNND